MSVSLAAERERIQRQIQELEQNLGTEPIDLDLLSTDTSTDDASDDDSPQMGSGQGELVFQREQIQREIEELETALSQNALCLSDEQDSTSDGSTSELGLPQTVDGCLQVNLVYQQVLQDSLHQLDELLQHNRTAQKELLSQMCGPIRDSSRDQACPSSYQQPIKMYLGRFLKPYFKDKLTGLGPPANQETRERTSKMTASLDNKQLKMKRWEGWQKTLLIHAVARDGMKRLIQPKLSKVDYLSQKMSSVGSTEQELLREQIDRLEKDIHLLTSKKEEELIGDRYDDHDWQKISNIDFEGTREADDICCFWQNFLHPSINKSSWSTEEVQRLEEISRRNGERNWEAIAKELGTGRSPFMCLQTFQCFVSKDFKRSSWSPDEDALLRQLVDKMRIGNFIPYTQMSYFMEGREPAQLMYRWTQVLDPSLRKGPWSKQEDQLLLSAVARHGERNWWKIRMNVPGRSDSSCRDRYHDCLKAGLKRGAFDKQERELLMKLIHKHGVGRWARIAAEIPNRHDAQCLREWKKIDRCRRRRVEKRRSGAIKKEEEEEEEELEEVIVYMDSDEEKKVVVEEEEKEEEEEEYVLPPLEECVPVQKVKRGAFLSCVCVSPPVSGPVQQGESAVRCTVLDGLGRCVDKVVGLNPREDEHSPCALLKVSSSELRSLLLCRARKQRGWPSSSTHRKYQTGFCDNKRRPIRVSSLWLHYQFLAALTPWIGHLLVPQQQRSRRTTAQALRQRGEEVHLPRTPVFLFLLQALNVDMVGCKRMIEERTRKSSLLTPAGRSQKTVLQMLQDNRKDTNKQQQQQLIQELQELERKPAGRPQLILQPQLQHKLILQQLQRVQPPRQQMPPNFPPIMCPQMLPTMPPQMSPLLYPNQTIFLAQPVVLPGQRLGAAPPSSAPPPPAAVASSPLSKSPPCPPSSSPALPPPSKEEIPPLLRHLPHVSTVQRSSTTAVHNVLPTSSTSAPPSSPNPSVTPASVWANQKAVPSALHPPTDEQPKGRKRRRSEENLSTNQNPVCMGVVMECEQKERKRVRKPSVKARALQEAAVAKTEAKKKAAPTQRCRSAGMKNIPSMEKPIGLPADVLLAPSQSLWIMTPNGLVPLGGATPPGLQLALPPACHPAPPMNVFINQLAPPPPRLSTNTVQHPSYSGPPTVAPPAHSVTPPPAVPQASSSLPSRIVSVLPSRPIQPHNQFALVGSAPQRLVLRAPPPGRNPSSGCLPRSFLLPSPHPAPPLSVLLPYKGTVRADPSALPDPRREALQLDPSLMFKEQRGEVQDWLSGRGGVVVPGLRVALPYLPPFISSLRTLTALLCAKRSLTDTALLLLTQGSDRDLTGAQTSEDRADPSRSSEPTEPERVAAVRRLVAERFADNPAYQQLKARFLSCFTVPALLATMQPTTEQLQPCPANEEEERGQRREKSVLLWEGQGAPAAHYTGIITRNTSKQLTLPDETRGDQTSPEDTTPDK